MWPGFATVFKGEGKNVRLLEGETEKSALQEEKGNQ